MWHDTLINRFRCDETSLMQLIALSQHSGAGFEQANSIVGKLLKGVSDGTTIGNYSAFVHRCVENARRAINPEGKAFAGKGGHK